MRAMPLSRSNARWGERALALATRLADEETCIHALVNIGAMKLIADHRQAAPLLEAHAAAVAAGQHHEATRALTVAGYSQLFWVQPEPAIRYSEQAHAYAREYDEPMFVTYTSLTRAWLSLRAGDWEAAERVVQRELAAQRAVSQLLAGTVAADLAIRRGDSDAVARVADVAARAYRTGELQRIAPVLELATVAALTGDGELPVDRFRSLVPELEKRASSAGCCTAWVAAWAAVAGVDVQLERELPQPFDAMLRRDWRGAADAFGAVGWTFDRALLLSLLDDEEALVEAIGIARALGAEPLTRRVARRLRALGLRVPRGPGKRPARIRSGSRRGNWKSWPSSPKDERMPRSPSSSSCRCERQSITSPPC